MVTPPDPAQTEKTGGGRILIVDDSRTQLLKMSKSVEMLGHEAVTCSDGASALGEISRGNVDVVLLDMVMPGMDGFAVLEKMKANEQLRDVPVIVISSLDDDTDSVARAIELGASDFLSKDYNPVILKARIRAGLERRRARTIELDYLRQVAKLTQAAAVLESGAFNPRALNIQDVANRPDGLGTLANVFMSMAQKVYEREQAFRRTIATLRGGFLLLALGCLYGLLTPLSRLASFSEASPWLLAFWMNLLGAAMLLAFAYPKLKQAVIGRQGWAFMVAAGVIGGAGEMLLFSASAELPASTVVMILALDSFIVFAIAAAVGHEKGNLRRFFGLLIGASAVLMIVIGGSQMKGAGAMIWYIIALAVPTLYALDYILIAARLPEHLDYSLLAGIMMTISALTTLPLVLWSGELAGTGDVIANSSLLIIILMMGAITALANALTFVLTKAAGAVFASQCSYATTFFGIAWSFILLQEQLDLWAWTALAMVILGLVIVGPRKAAEPQPPGELRPKPAEAAAS
jgi:DNA-binding response OmpR family regulator/drug/metabolite transporter (DMT)-like permease